MYRLDGVDDEVRSYFAPVAKMVLSSRDPQEALEVRSAGGTCLLAAGLLGVAGVSEALEACRSAALSALGNQFCLQSLAAYSHPMPTCVALPFLPFLSFLAGSPGCAERHQGHS